MFELRPMVDRDIPTVLAIQAECYGPALLEEEAVLRSRLAAFARQCWVATDTLGVCAYLFGYLSRVGLVTPLAGEFTRFEQPDCLYLHDLAVAARGAGRGIGPALVERNLEGARTQQLNYSALVSVQQSADFWARLGYSATDQLDAGQLENLLSYPVPACYMVRELA